MRRLLSVLSLLTLIAIPDSWAKDFVVFSVMQDVPMGEPNEIIHKNFYINMGITDGVKEGTTLDIYRGILRSNPYQNNQQHNLSIKIAKVKVIHVESNVCIAQLDSFEDPKTMPALDVRAVMIGDVVKVSID